MFTKSISLLLVLFVVEIHSAHVIVNNEFARAIGGNTSYAQLLLFKFHNDNRTKKSLDIAMEFLQDITKDDDLTIHCQVFTWKSNQYKRTPIQFNVSTCKLLDANLFAVRNYIKSTGITTCPVKKGTYELHNITPTEENWPSLMPDGRYMFQVEFTFRKIKTLTIEWMVEIISKKTQGF